MMDYSETQIIELRNKISELEMENRLLKERMDEAGVSYADIVSDNDKVVAESYAQNQGARIKRFEITDKVARDFFVMFCRGRKDVYDLRYTNPKTGKNGYYTQCFNRWDRDCHIQKRDGVRCKDCELRAYKPITLPLIKAHMTGTDPNGNDVVAIYPMLENNLCQLLVFDFDNHAKGAEQDDHANIDDSWKEEINALRRICKNLDVDAVVERSRSGRGAHLWIFFKEMIPARLARRFGFALLEKGAESVNLKSFRYYDRMIPTQDVLPDGGLGNVIALPLQGLALKSGNSAFVDDNWNAYEDQLKVLAGTRRLTRQEIEDYLSLWYSAGSVSEDDGNDTPWDKSTEIESGGVDGVVHIVLSDSIYIDSSGMTNKTKRQLRRMATFSNKQYFQNQAMDIPNYDASRFIYLGRDEGKYIVLPRGLREEILKRFDDAGVRYEIEDKRTVGRKLNISFKGNLRESQIPAVETMLENETGILHAATAFGKTVVCCDMIARRSVSTLILVDRADLMNQWLKRLDEFLDIDEDLPEYQTKSGRTRKRKTLIGNLQGAHDTLTGIVDVAMIRSLKKKDGFHPMLKEYSQVYFDECHHAASDSAIEVLQEINAKYVYGVTATPKRGDGKERINEFLLGPIRYRFTAKDRAEEQNIDHLVYPRFTKTVKPHHLSKTPYGNEAFELIRNNDVRDEQIIRDVVECVQADERNRIMERNDVSLFDQNAFREAIINAFVHNKWVDGNAPMITIYSNRIEILSRGNLAPGQTKEGFYAGESIPVNQKLSDIFLQLHISERSGRGVPKITEVYGENAFEFRENSIVVTLPLKYLDSDVVDKVAYKPVDNVILNATQERLLRELRNNPNLTQPQLASIMGLGKSAIQNNISFLKKNGYIERVGANKRGYWRIKE